MKNRYPKAYIVLASMIIAVLAALSFLDLSFFKYLDRLAYDAESLFHTKSIQADDHEFVLLLADTPPMTQMPAPPLGNRDLARLIGILEERKVKQILITFPVTRENPDFPQALEQLRKKLLADPGIRNKGSTKSRVTRYCRELENLLDWDSILAKRVQDSGNVWIALPVAGEGKRLKPAGEWVPKALFRADKNASRYFQIEGIRIASPAFVELYSASAGIGHNLLVSNDGLPGRMHQPFLTSNFGLLPSLPVLLAMNYLGATPSQVEISAHQLKIGPRVVPLCHGLIILCPTRLGRDFTSYSISEILKNNRAPLELHNKIVIVGIKAPLVQMGKPVTAPFGKPLSAAQLVAGIAENIIHGPYITRPNGAQFLEFVLMVLVGFLGAFLFPRARYLSSALLLPLLVLLSLFTGWVFLSFFGIWLKVSYAVTAAVAMFVLCSSIQIMQLDRVTKEAIEANRLLGLNFQKQGVMDLAFERFKMCPLNNVTRDLIYEMAQECENRGLNTLAWQAYSYILKRGEFRDAAKRLAELETLEKFPGFDPQGARKREGPLSESFIQQRKMLGKYQVIERLGKGTMGYVYKAVDTTMNRPVALKIIRFSDEFDEDLISEIRERFFREAEIAGQLNHPSIVTVYDVGENRDLTFMAMEYLEGHDLERYCNPDNLLPLMKVLEIVYQIADALDYAHQKGVIHRDIKPANIMLLKNGTVKVMDFGIAKAVSTSRTKTGVILGTPNYMSPEQIMGHTMDARSDIFSLGVLFFQLLTGQLPFHADNLSSLLYQITQARHPSVRELRPRIPKACEQIVDKALAKSRENRFKSARDMKRYIHLLILRLKEIRSKTRSN